MKPVVGYEGLFSVTKDGKVWSHRTNKFLKLAKHKRPSGKISLQVCIRIGGRKGKAVCLKIHRLIAEAYIPNPDNKPQVNHIDGNPSNNHKDNLEWVTGLENMQHALRTGLLRFTSGAESVSSKLSSTDVAYIRKNYKPWDKEFGARPLSRKFGVSHTVIVAAAGYSKRKSYNNVV